MTSPPVLGTKLPADTRGQETSPTLTEVDDALSEKARSENPRGVVILSLLTLALALNGPSTVTYAFFSGGMTVTWGIRWFFDSPPNAGYDVLLGAGVGLAAAIGMGYSPSMLRGLDLLVGPVIGTAIGGTLSFAYRRRKLAAPHELGVEPRE